MAEEEKLKAQCPNCGVQVLATKEQLTKTITCPRCKRAVQFEMLVGDDVVIKQAASTAAQGVKKAGILAGGLLKRAAALGAAKYRDRRERSVAVRQFREQLRTHVETQWPSREALDHFVQQGQALDLDLKKEAAPLLAQLRAFMARETTRIRSTASLAPDHQAALREYFTTFGVGDDLLAQFDQAAWLVRRIEDINTGRAKPLESVDGLVLRSTEVAWYQCEACGVERSSKGETLHPGRLFVTNGRIVFTSRTAPDEIDIKGINAVEAERGRIFLTGRSGSTEFQLTEPDIAAAHIRRAIQVIHRHVDVGFEGGSSRHIPQDVKQAVFRRDNGRCAECGATDYLEYDHIIPHSKGGASTLDNVQLLCRRCNLKKSDRI